MMLSFLVGRGNVRVKGLLVLLLVLVNSSTGSSVVHSPPLIIKQPPVTELLFQVPILVNETPKPFIIECEAEGFPEPNYNWTKNGVPFHWEDENVGEEIPRITQQPGRGTLIVTRPIVEDAGQYQCFAYNEFGVGASNTVFVRMSELSAFRDDSTITTVSTQEGLPFKLPCEAPYGWPKPIVYWMMQNQLGALKSINSSRNTVDPDGTLWFSNVTLSDRSSEFNYACSAYSPFRNEYKLGNRVYLNVAPMGSDYNSVDPVWQYITTKNAVGVRGQTLDLWCVAGGTPIPEIKWSKKGDSLPYDRLEYDNYGKTLKILNADFSDEGTYICEADNGMGKRLTHSISVTINAAPYFKVEPDIINEAEGENAIFTCEANGKPNPDIKWIHNGLPIEKAPHNPRRKVQKNKVTLTNILKSDTGNYGCNASNSLGYVYKDVYLNVLALPAEFTEIPKNTTTTEGSTVTLTCRALGAPKPKITWIKNGDPVKERNYRPLPTGDLQITNVAFTDSGPLTCFAQNKFGKKSQEAFLTVKAHTVIHQDGRPSDSEVAAGTSATFRCDAAADESLPLHVDWYADGELIDFDTQHRFVKLPDNSLVIDKTSEQDSGTYTCVARTEYDNATASAQLTVQDVPERPDIVDVDCGPSTARVSWRPRGHNNAPITYFTIQENTSFTPETWGIAFKDVPPRETSYTVRMSPWANYTFRVIARNKIGPSLPSAHSRVCTTPEDVPHKNPENVRGDGTAPNNLRISWTPMPEIEHNAPGFKYQIKWRQEDDGDTEYQIREVTNWRVGEIIIPDQPTYRPYSIQVRAINSKGESNVAPTSIRGHSGQDVPTTAPANFTLLDKIDGRTALVSWDAVDPSTLNGKFEGYKVETWTDHEGEENTREILIKNDVTKAVVDKLVPFSRNFMRVFAYNTVYNGPSSRVIEVVTGEGTPGPVESLDAFPLGPDSIYLKWQKPEQPNGILRGYFLTWSEVSGTKVKTETERTKNITDPTKMEAKLSHLKRLTTYRIGIEGYTGEGRGDSRFIETKTLEGAALKLAKPKFRWDHEPAEDGVTGVKIIWLPGTDGEGRPGDQFFVKYKKFGTDTYMESEIVTDEDFKVIRGLDTDEVYIFQVVAVDSINPDIRSESNAEEIYTKYPADGPYVQPKEAGPAAGWFIGLIVALAFLLLCIILICIVKRNRGGKYAVYEREIAHGRHEFDDGGFREFSQPSGRSSMMDSSYRPQESDTDSMQGDEAAKFTEDGSFIGQYGVKKKSELPSPTAAYV